MTPTKPFKPTPNPLRDDLAKAAMIEVVRKGGIASETQAENCQRIADFAYCLADEMMKRRAM
jgi:hypothetical protein